MCKAEIQPDQHKEHIIKTTHKAGIRKAHTNKLATKTIQEEFERLKQPSKTKHHKVEAFLPQKMSW